MSDTDRFNHATGVPPVEDRAAGERPQAERAAVSNAEGIRPAGERPQAERGPELHNARRRLRMVRLGVPLEWEEEPFQWVRPRTFSVVRHYTRGPLTQMRIQADLSPEPAGGTLLVYQVWAQARSLLGLAGIPVQVGLLSARQFRRAFHLFDRMAAYKPPSLALADGAHLGAAPSASALGAASPVPSGATPPVLRAGVDEAGSPMPPGGRARLDEYRQTLIANGQSPELVAYLAETIVRAGDHTLARMRPYVLAADWGAPRQDVLKLFLWATRAGLLDFQWDLLCPLCRGAKASSGSLRGLQATVHCDVCRIDYSVNFERFVELTFRPNPSVREIESRPFCVGGPQVTPHIVVQQLLAPGANRSFALDLVEGGYRARVLELPGFQLFQVGPGGAPEVTLQATAGGWSEQEGKLAPHTTLHLENSTPAEQLFILERTMWSDQAVTAVEVITLQTFRDLFASEALRPGQQISVGSLTVVFTDLRDSTRMYGTIGDAPAFGRVMDHFEVLCAAIDAEGGSVVKTIGDAVMAVFRRPLSALRAMLAAQQTMAAQPHSEHPLVLKVAIHHGPCISVTLNDRLDYFGSTVNIAARIQQLASGDDVLVSEAVWCDPEVVEWIAHNAPELAIESFESALKGIEGRFNVWRVTRSEAKH